MKFIIGTTSELKRNAVKEVISRLVPGSQEVIGMDAESGVPATPWDQDTFNGARNRAHACQNSRPDSDFWIGLESGGVERYGSIFEEAWACVVTPDNREHLGYSSGLKIPDHVLRQMDLTGAQHSEVMRQLRKDPHGVKDTWGDYTGGLLLRSVSLQEALRNALLQIFSPEESYYHTPSQESETL